MSDLVSSAFPVHHRHSSEEIDDLCDRISHLERRIDKMVVEATAAIDVAREVAEESLEEIVEDLEEAAEQLEEAAEHEEEERESEEEEREPESEEEEVEVHEESHEPESESEPDDEPHGRGPFNRRR